MAGKRKFTEDQESEICSLYKAGKNASQLSVAFGVAPKTIRGVIKRHGEALKSRSEALRKLSDSTEDQICTRYKAGESTNKLGAAFGTDHSTICQILKRHGVERRAKALSVDDEAEVCRRYLTGESTMQLGPAFGVHNSTIANILNNNGITRRSSGESRRILSAEDDAEVCRRYLAGENIYQLGSAFEVRPQTICYNLERNGIKRRASDGYGDSVRHILDSTGRHAAPRECEFYLFELARHNTTHCKPGIAFDVDTRAGASCAQGEYGAEVLRLVFSTRAEAYFLEQAVLDATRSNADCPADLIEWSGASEVRAMPAEDMVPTVLRLAEELEQLGAWDFAVRYVPMSAAQRVTCQQRAMTYAPAD